MRHEVAIDNHDYFDFDNGSKMFGTGLNFFKFDQGMIKKRLIIEFKINFFSNKTIIFHLCDNDPL